MDEAIANMWRKTEAFDLNGVTGLKGLAAQDTLKYRPETNNDDYRSIVNDRIHIADKKGQAFIYDVALSDFEAFEDETLRILTMYLNGQENIDKHPSSTYLDDLRPKMPKIRSNPC